MVDGKDWVTYQVTPLQYAFLEYCRRHPYCHITGLRLHEDIPVEAQVKQEDGTYETVSFAKVAKEEGLLPE